MTANIDPVYKCVIFALFFVRHSGEILASVVGRFLSFHKKGNKVEAPVSGHPGEAEKCLELAAYGKNSRKMTEAVSGVGELVPVT